MDKPMVECRIKPTEVCQYGVKCYRKNPHHFIEYAHQHLDKIIDENATNNIEDYKVSSDLQKDLILEQIKIMNELFPNVSIQPTAKKTKASESQETIVKVPETREIPQPNTSIVTIDLSHSVDECAPSNSRSNENHTNTATKNEAASSININDFIKVIRPKGKMNGKLAASAPYNYFLTAITSSEPTHNEPLSITFQEILDPSLGDLESSVQINFMVDIGWLLGHYYFAKQMDKPLLVLYGSDMPELRAISQKKPNVTTHMVQMGNPGVGFAIHHTKMMLFAYKDKSMRVVISTANLYEADWHNRTQGNHFFQIPIFLCKLTSSCSFF